MLIENHLHCKLLDMHTEYHYTNTKINSHDCKDNSILGIHLQPYWHLYIAFFIVVYTHTFLILCWPTIVSMLNAEGKLLDLAKMYVISYWEHCVSSRMQIKQGWWWNLKPEMGEWMASILLCWWTGNLGTYNMHVVHTQILQTCTLWLLTHTGIGVLSTIYEFRSPTCNQQH